MSVSSLFNINGIILFLGLDIPHLKSSLAVKLGEVNVAGTGGGVADVGGVNKFSTFEIKLK